MEKFTPSTVPDGHFWYRCQYKNNATGEVSWTPWEIVVIFNDDNLKRPHRIIAGRFWRGRLERVIKDETTKGLRSELYQIPLPPPDDEDQGKTKVEADPNEGVRPAGDAPGPNG